MAVIIRLSSTDQPGSGGGGVTRGRPRGRGRTSPELHFPPERGRRGSACATIAKARRISAEAEAYATEVVAEAIAKNGLEAAQYQVALKQVEALAQVASGEGKQTVLLPSNALDAFADAFTMLKGAGK
jgi:hypothetical protein